MKNVRLLVSRADQFGAQFVGQVVEVTDEEAARMIDARQAEEVESETTTRKPRKRRSSKS